MFLLVPAHPGCPGQIPQSRKTVVCVCLRDVLSTENNWCSWLCCLEKEDEEDFFRYNKANLMLLVGRQEGHPACKETEWWGDGMVISLGEVQICIWPSWCHCHSLSLAAVNPDWFYQNGSAFLVPAYPGCPGKKAVKRM